MTWKELQEHIETLNDDQKNLYIILYDASRDVYYIVADVVEDKDLSKDPCLFISQL